MTTYQTSLSRRFNGLTLARNRVPEENQPVRRRDHREPLSSCLFLLDGRLENWQCIETGTMETKIQ